MTETVTPPVPPTASPAVETSGRAIAALVIGIVGLVVCQLLSPLAWVLGWQELRDVREGRAPAGNEGMATAGMVLGVIGSALLALAVLAVLLVVGIVLACLAVAGGIAAAAV